MHPIRIYHNFAKTKPPPRIRLREQRDREGDGPCWPCRVINDDVREEAVGRRRRCGSSTVGEETVGRRRRRDQRRRRGSSTIEEDMSTRSGGGGAPTTVVDVDGEGARLLEEGRQRWSGARTKSGDDSWSVLKPGVLARAGCRRWAVEWGGRQRRGGAKRGSNARRSDSGGLEREVGAWWTVRERSRTGRP
jgi:hypothetical protein